MNLEERSRLSYYREIAPLDAEHDVKLVRHSESGQLFVRKTLVNYQPGIFLQLKADPIPRMPRIMEAVEEEGRLIVIATYLDGRTLQDVVDEQGILPVSAVCRIGRQLCGILSLLHRRGIVHRDVKPSNIILSEDGIVKLLDLDAAKVWRPGEDRDTKLIGTHGYAAPEQYGFGASSPATDIYAVGVLLNVMAAGDLPGAKMPADERLCSVIRRCTRLEPEERYRSAEEVEAALEDVEQNAEEKKGNTEAEPKTAARQRRWKSWLPPGFRSGNIWKMIFAAFWYLAVVQLTISFLTNPPEGSSRFDSIAEAGMALISGISLPLFLFNYRGIWQKLRINRIRSMFWRRVAAFSCVVLLTLAFTISFAAIGSVLIRMGVIPPE